MVACLVPLVPSCGGLRCLHARRVPERLKSLGSGTLCIPNRGSNGRKKSGRFGAAADCLLFVLSVVVCCVLCLHCVQYSAWCDARVLTMVHAI